MVGQGQDLPEIEHYPDLGLLLGQGGLPRAGQPLRCRAAGQHQYRNERLHTGLLSGFDRPRERGWFRQGRLSSPSKGAPPGGGPGRRKRARAIPP